MGAMDIHPNGQSRTSCINCIGRGGELGNAQAEDEAS